MNYLLAISVGISAVAAIIDLRSDQIPNWLTLGTLFGTLLGSFLADINGGLGTYMGCQPLLGAVLCAIIPGLLYWRNVIGGGDVKLLIGLGALLHPLWGLEMEMNTYFSAGLLAPIFLAYEGKLLQTLKAILLWQPDRIALLTRFQLGPAVFLGVSLTAYLHWK